MTPLEAEAEASALWSALSAQADSLVVGGGADARRAVVPRVPRGAVYGGAGRPAPRWGGAKASASRPGLDASMTERALHRGKAAARVVSAPARRLGGSARSGRAGTSERAAGAGQRVLSPQRERLRRGKVGHGHVHGAAQHRPRGAMATAASQVGVPLDFSTARGARGHDATTAYQESRLLLARAFGGGGHDGGAPRALGAPAGAEEEACVELLRSAAAAAAAVGGSGRPLATLPGARAVRPPPPGYEAAAGAYRFSVDGVREVLEREGGAPGVRRLRKASRVLLRCIEASLPPGAGAAGTALAGGTLQRTSSAQLMRSSSRASTTVGGRASPPASPRSPSEATMFAMAAAADQCPGSSRPGTSGRRGGQFLQRVVARRASLVGGSPFVAARHGDVPHAHAHNPTAPGVPYRLLARSLAQLFSGMARTLAARDEAAIKARSLLQSVLDEYDLNEAGAAERETTTYTRLYQLLDQVKEANERIALITDENRALGEALAKATRNLDSTDEEREAVRAEVLSSVGALTGVATELRRALDGADAEGEGRRHTARAMEKMVEVFPRGARWMGRARHAATMTDAVEVQAPAPKPADKRKPVKKKASKPEHVVDWSFLDHWHMPAEFRAEVRAALDKPYNIVMNRRDLLALIGDFWQKKIEHDARCAKRKAALPDVPSLVLDFYTLRSTVRSVVAKDLYKLIYTLRVAADEEAATSAPGGGALTRRVLAFKAALQCAGPDAELPDMSAQAADFYCIALTQLLATVSNAEMYQDPKTIDERVMVRLDDFSRVLRNAAQKNPRHLQPRQAQRLRRRARKLATREGVWKGQGFGKGSIERTNSSVLAVPLDDVLELAVRAFMEEQESEIALAVAEYRAADTNRNGMQDPSEFAAMLKKLAPHFGELEAAKLYREALLESTRNLSDAARGGTHGVTPEGFAAAALRAGIIDSMRERSSAACAIQLWWRRRKGDISKAAGSLFVGMMHQQVAKRPATAMSSEGAPSRPMSPTKAEETGAPLTEVPTDEAPAAAKQADAPATEDTDQPEAADSPPAEGEAATA